MAEISKSTFKTMPVDSKLCVLFDIFLDMQKEAKQRVHSRDLRCQHQVDECEKKFNVIHRRITVSKVINTGLILCSGFAGGFSAVWSAFKFGWFGG